MTFMRKTALAISVLCILAACTSEAQAEGAVIKIENFTFEPQALTVKVGTTVTWTNADDIPHQVVEVSHKYHSPALDTSDSFSMTFTVAGTSEYFCGLHPHMQGKIIVEP